MLSILAAEDFSPKAVSSTNVCFERFEPPRGGSNQHEGDGCAFHSSVTNSLVESMLSILAAEDFSPKAVSSTNVCFERFGPPRGGSNQHEGDGCASHSSVTNC